MSPETAALFRVLLREAEERATARPVTLEPASAGRTNETEESAVTSNESVAAGLRALAEMVEEGYAPPSVLREASRLLELEEAEPVEVEPGSGVRREALMEDAVVDFMRDYR